MKNEFGKYIKLTREGKKIGLRCLGREIKISATYLSRIENGKEKPPSVVFNPEMKEVLLKI